MIYLSQKSKIKMLMILFIVIISIPVFTFFHHVLQSFLFCFCLSFVSAKMRHVPSRPFWISAALPLNMFSLFLCFAFSHLAKPLSLSL